MPPATPPTPAPATRRAPRSPFHDALPSLDARDLLLLAVLALAEPVNVSNFTDLANMAGARETATRRLSTATTRSLLDRLMALGLVQFDPAAHATYSCELLVRYPALRHAAATGALPIIVGAIGPIIQTRSFSRYSRSEYATALFQAQVALSSVSPSPNAEQHLDQARATARSYFDLDADLTLPALTAPFDADWFSRLTPPLRTRLTRNVLVYAEHTGAPLRHLHTFLSDHLGTGDLDVIGNDPSLMAPLGGVALLSGDLDLARRLAPLPAAGQVGRNLQGAISVVEGRYDEALEQFAATDKKRFSGRAGICGILHVLALVRRARPEDLDLARRLATVGARKDDPFYRTHGILRDVVEAVANPAAVGSAKHLLSSGDSADCCTFLARGLFALWFDVGPIETEIALGRAGFWPERLVRAGRPWLASQYEDVLKRLGEKISNPKVRAVYLERRSVFDITPLGPPLYDLRASRPAWEFTLDQLEQLVGPPGADGLNHAETSDERIIWRVDPRRFSIEPFVQKRTGGRFTKGRKLAIKHLSDPDGAKLPLSAEDARVAAFAQEERRLAGGYPQSWYYIDRRAWTALVGHPRVYLGDAEEPTEVVQGTVQLVARTQKNDLRLSVEPPGLESHITIRLETGKIVVFAIQDERIRSLLRLIGDGLWLPSQGRQRALDIVGRLSAIVPVQSTQAIAAPSRPADPTPCLRLVPWQRGLSVTLHTRPLGANGPSVTPGQGARTLVGQNEGKPVQTERDLAQEIRLARRIIESCAILSSYQAGEWAWEVDDPEACLDLISALRDLDPSVQVEWPQGKPLRLRARLGRQAFRGGLRHEAGYFLASGALAVDEGLTLELGELLALLQQQPGRFVRLAEGDYVEIERELREMLETMAAVQSEGRSEKGGAAIPASALALLEQITSDDAGFELDSYSKAWRERVAAAFEKRIPIPRGLEADLRDYQAEGFRWLARLAEIELGACLADDMGLGKTVQLIALLLSRAKSGPALVVAPTSVCNNWHLEIERFAPSLRPCIYAGSGRQERLAAMEARDVVIASYALLQQDAEGLQAIRWSTAVLDEAQFIKNAETLRAKAAFGLKAAVRIAATGTPIENHIDDLFSIFRFISPDLLGSRARFHRRFATGADQEEPTTRRALRRIIQPLVLRRTKAEVLEDLPPITEIQHTVTLSPAEAALYEAVRRAALSRLEQDERTGSAHGRDRLQVLAEITKLRRMCCHPALAVPEYGAESSKLSAFEDLVEELLDGHHRALVFSQFVDMLTLARKLLDARKITYQYLDGATSPARRAAAVEAFQSGEGDLFLISLRAGGFGLNLTGADYVIHLDPWWNPAVEAQAAGRAHRIGQTRPVTVYRLVCAGTVEERIVELHRTKREMADSLLEGTEKTATLSAEELRALLEP